jgi:hypothetical protein
MYVDALLALSGSISGNTVTGQTVFSAGTSVLSTNTVDLASGGIPSGQVRDIGEGSDFAFGRFEVTVAAVGGTSMEFQIITADDAALTTNVKVLGTTGAIPVASLTLGSRFACDINPVIGSKGQRYVGGRTVSVGTTTAGSIYADIGAEIQDGQKFFPNGFAVL